jgi:hypothetical protein
MVILRSARDFRQGGPTAASGRGQGGLPKEVLPQEVPSEWRTWKSSAARGWPDLLAKGLRIRFSGLTASRVQTSCFGEDLEVAGHLPSLRAEEAPAKIRRSSELQFAYAGRCQPPAKGAEQRLHDQRYDEMGLTKVKEVTT